MSSHKSARTDVIMIVILIIIYNTLMDIYCIRRYRSYNAGAFDLGIAAQTLWNTSHGDILHESVNLGKPASRPWNGRWELILIPIALLYRIFDRVEFILLLQTMIISLGIIPTYILSKQKLGGVFIPFCLSIAYILNPVIHNPNLFDFHSVSLSIPMIIFLIYFSERNNISMMFLTFILILSCREDLAPLLFAYSIYLYLLRKRLRLPAVFLSLSIIWFMFTTNTSSVRNFLGLPEIIPSYTQAGRWDHIGGTDPLGILFHFFDNPMSLIKSIFNIENLKYLIKITAPFSFLPLFNLKMVFIALPNFLINGMSHWSLAHHIEHHYNAHVGAVMMVSSIYAVSKISGFNILGTCSTKKRMEKIVALVFVLASLTAAILWSRYKNISKWQVSGHHEILNGVVKKIDPDASISSHFLILDHIANRKELYMFPDNIDEVDYVIDDIRLPFNRIMTHTIISNKKVDPINSHLKWMINNRGYGIELYEDGIILFKKGGDWSSGIEMLIGVDREVGFEPVNIQTHGGVFIESFKYHGICGANDNVASYSLICRNVESSQETLKIVFMLTDGNERFRSICNSLAGGIQDEGIKKRLQSRYKDEINVRIPAELTGNKITLYVLGDDLDYHYFDTILTSP